MEGVGTRFELELELMNCLASPEYLHCESCLYLVTIWDWYRVASPLHQRMVEIFRRAIPMVAIVRANFLNWQLLTHAL